MGSFCPAAGTRNPHRDCNFAERVAETVPKSLRHSCRSELTRQGISLDLLLRDFSSRGPVISADLCMSPCSPDFLFELTSADQIVWRQVSEDSAPFRMRPFLLI